MKPFQNLIIKRTDLNIKLFKSDQFQLIPKIQVEVSNIRDPEMYANPVITHIQTFNHVYGVCNHIFNFLVNVVKKIAKTNISYAFIQKHFHVTICELNTNILS